MTFKTFVKKSERLFIQARYRISCRDNISTIICIQNAYKNELDKYNHFAHFLRSSNKKTAIGQLLIKVLDDVVELLKNDSYEQAYDLVDAFHCLPSIFMAHGYVIPEDYWKLYVEPYSIKWDSTYLMSIKRIFGNILSI